MFYVNNIPYEKGCIVYIDTFPLEKLVLSGKCLVRIGTRYEVYHEYVTKCKEIFVPRDTVLIMIFQYRIDDDYWDKLYRPSPRDLTSLCSIAIVENQLEYPSVYKHIISQVSEEECQPSILIYDNDSSSDESEYETTTDEDDDDEEDE